MSRRKPKAAPPPVDVPEDVRAAWVSLILAGDAKTVDVAIELGVRMRVVSGWVALERARRAAARQAAREDKAREPAARLAEIFAAASPGAALPLDDLARAVNDLPEGVVEVWCDDRARLAFGTNVLREALRPRKWATEVTARVAEHPHSIRGWALYVDWRVPSLGVRGGLRLIDKGTSRRDVEGVEHPRPVVAVVRLGRAHAAQSA